MEERPFNTAQLETIKRIEYDMWTSYSTWEAKQIRHLTKMDMLATTWLVERSQIWSWDFLELKCSWKRLLTFFSWMR